jgi:predicted DNA-binding protein
MARGITTSIRLTPKTRLELELASRFLKRGKNWIVNEALQAYLTRMSLSSLINEAKKQSLLASKAVRNENNLWEENSDTQDWSA